MGGWMDGCMYESMGGCMYGCMDGYMDGCMHGWIRGWMHIGMGRVRKTEKMNEQ